MIYSQLTGHMEGDEELWSKYDGERRSSLNGKSRNGRSKKLRRRNSETFSPRGAARTVNGDSVLTRRRGSLPIEVLSHSGQYYT